MARTPIHPGVILGDELAELGMSAAALARTLRVPTNRITQIIKGQHAVTADAAMRLSKWLGTSPSFWLNLQQAYELRLACVCDAVLKMGAGLPKSACRSGLQTA